MILYIEFEFKKAYFINFLHIKNYIFLFYLLIENPLVQVSSQVIEFYTILHFLRSKEREGIVIQMENFFQQKFPFALSETELLQVINKIKKTLIDGRARKIRRLSPRAAILGPRLDFILTIYKMQYIIIPFWLCSKKEHE